MSLKDVRISITTVVGLDRAGVLLTGAVCVESVAREESVASLTTAAREELVRIIDGLVRADGTLEDLTHAREQVVSVGSGSLKMGSKIRVLNQVEIEQRDALADSTPMGEL